MMDQKQTKSLSDLAVKLRVLGYSEKKAYLTELDEYAKDHYIQMASGYRPNPFSLQSLAYSMYYSLEGIPYIQPEFPSQATMKDVKARTKFNSLFAGIVAYTKASNEQQRLFKKSALKPAGSIAKISYLIKSRQRALG